MHSPGPLSPLGSPGRVQCCGLADPVVHNDRRTHYSKNHQGTLWNKIYYSQALEGTQHAQVPHRDICGSRRGSMDMGVCLNEGQGLGVSGVSPGHLLLANLKNRSGKLGERRVEAG